MRPLLSDDGISPNNLTMPCGVCGIANTTLDNSAAYLQSWMRVLRHDPTLLVHAAAQAQKAADYLQNRHPDAGAVRAGDDDTPCRRVPTS